MQKNKITVKIFGSEYTIKGEAETEYIRKIAAYVDEKMHSIAKKFSIISSTKIAILAAINIADELFNPQIKDTQKQEINNTLKRIISKIEKATQ